MASHFKKGETIIIPFIDDWTVCDSQGKPRMYKTRKAFEKALPKHYIDARGVVELAEYALVRHGRWIDMQEDDATEGMWRCSACGNDRYFDIMTPEESGCYYCPNCGAKMDLEG